MKLNKLAKSIIGSETYCISYLMFRNLGYDMYTGYMIKCPRTQYMDMKDTFIY